MFENIHLRVNIIALTVTGVLPLKLEGRFKFLNTVHRIYASFVLIYFVTFVATEIAEVINILGGDILEVVGNLGVSLLYAVCIVKIYVCGSQPVIKLMKQIREREKSILESDDQFIKEIYMANAKYNIKISKTFIWLGVVTIAPFYFNAKLMEIQNPPDAFFDIVDNDTIVYRPRPLPFSSWFPFDKYKYYPVSYAVHVVAGTIGASLTVSTDILFYGLMIYAIGQIKILQHYLQEFKEYSKQIARNNGILSEDEAIDIFIRKCVKDHKVIIKYIKDLDHSMRFLMLLDFALASMQMAMLGFQIIFVGLGLTQFFAAEYLLAMLMQLFLFYWSANEILLESSQISKSIYNSDWFECQPKIKRTFLLMMMRASKPLTLNVGPFYAMSTSTALSILRAAYSYVALLRQTYMRKEA